MVAFPFCCGSRRGSTKVNVRGPLFGAALIPAHLSIQATDYENIITQKMDVDTVSRTLKLNRYPTVEALFGDLLLVYGNAIRYFEQGGAFKSNDVYEAAKVCRGRCGFVAVCGFSFLPLSSTCWRHCTLVAQGVLR